MRRRFLAFRGLHPALARVVGVIGLVGEEVAVVASTGLPGKLSAAPLNPDCRHEGWEPHAKTDRMEQKRGKDRKIILCNI